MKQTLLRLPIFLVIALTVGLSVYTANARKLLGNEMPMPFGYGFSAVLSGSMEPAVSVDDLVVIKAGTDYAVGDVVAYNDGYATILHRIVELDENSAVTKGDANNVADEPISRTAIIGKMVAKWNGGAKIVGAIQSPPGIISILTVAVLLLFLSYQKEREEGNKELEAIRAEIELLKKQKESTSHGENEK